MPNYVDENLRRENIRKRVQMEKRGRGRSRRVKRLSKQPILSSMLRMKKRFLENPNMETSQQPIHTKYSNVNQEQHVQKSLKGNSIKIKNKEQS